MTNRARVGYESSHLRFIATDGVSSVPAIMFRAPHIQRAYACEGLVDLVADAVNESWQGRTNPKLMVSDILYRDERLHGADELADELFTSGHEHGGRSPRGQDLAQAKTGPQTLRKKLERLSDDALTDDLRRRLIGEHELLPAQQEALSRLRDGRSTLCVMATGRGKSLIFHLHAARIALHEHKASVFVFPLRALVSDQAFHLRESLGDLGLCVCVLTGETTAPERDRVYDGLKRGTVDVILTTPEYLALHTQEIARSGRVGLLVIDEAHHAGAAQGRDAYGELSRIRCDLGGPVALAVTATASGAVTHEICRLLSIGDNDVVVDRSVRANLRIADHRDLRDRDKLLVSLVAQGQKTVIYVNSRSQAVSLARTLRDGIPDLGHRIAFYHAGLPRDLRLRVEEEFRDGRLCCIVSTSAFGEGVNLPGIRNVVLYHMPFGATEFNQMSGRAGRDGKRACVHLLFGGRDARINEAILWSLAPSRDDLVALYKALMTQSRRSDGDVVLSDAQLLEVVRGIDATCRLTEGGVASGIAVFQDLGFLTVKGFDASRHIRMASSPGHVDLCRSLRYVEGVRALTAFTEFRTWVLTSTPQEMLDRINRPIAPDFGLTVDG